MIKSFYIEEERKTIFRKDGFKAVHLSLTVKCSESDFAKSVERVAKQLAAADLENVKNISIILESSE
jgi:hypothetical protein